MASAKTNVYMLDSLSWPILNVSVVFWPVRMLTVRNSIELDDIIWPIAEIP